MSIQHQATLRREGLVVQVVPVPPAYQLAQAGRGGAPDEVGTVGALLLGADGAFIIGSDFLMDGGVTASYFYGELAPQ